MKSLIGLVIFTTNFISPEIGSLLHVPGIEGLLYGLGLGALHESRPYECFRSQGIHANTQRKSMLREKRTPTLKEWASEEELIKGPEEEGQEVEENPKKACHGSQEKGKGIMKPEGLTGSKEAQ